MSTKTKNSKKAAAKDQDPVVIPENFATTIRDFLADLSATFPEYAHMWAKWTHLDGNTTVELFTYISKVYPERFFDILYQNDEIFQSNSETETRFLPDVDFRLLFQCDGVSEKTREAIWKYLQLILMTILKSVKNKVHFGDAANMFDGVDETVLQDKLKETMEGIGEFFKGLNIPESGQGGGDMGAKFAEAAENMEKMFEEFADQPSGPESAEQSNSNSNSNPYMNMPGAEEINEHLKGLFDGKIGSLAKELAEEIAKDVEHLFDDEIGTNPNANGNKKPDIESTQDLLKKMMRNPKKMMDLMKTIGTKIQNKMKSGEISEEEIMKEASELMGKMKGLGGKAGKGQFAEIMKNMANVMGQSGKGAKFNAGAFQKMERQFAAKERMQSKLEAKKLESTGDPTRKVFRMDDREEQQHSSIQSNPNALNDEELEQLFSKDKSSNKKAKKQKK